MSLALLAGCSAAHRSDGNAAAESGASASASPAAAAVAAPSGTPFAVMTPTATSRPRAVAASRHRPPALLAASTPPPAVPAARTMSPAVALTRRDSVDGVASARPPAPRILSVRTSPAVVHDGDTLVWNVRTSPDVVDVVAHVAVYAFRLQKQAVGQYLLSFTIPHGVPGFFHGNYTLDLEARSASGGAASTKVPVSFR